MILLVVESDVEVLLSLDLVAPAVSGGLSIEGLGMLVGLAILRKSIYAGGGEIGVLIMASSVLTMEMVPKGDAMPAEGRPAEGSPAEASGSLSTAERGVLLDTAEAIASGKKPFTGVVRAASLGLVAGIVVTAMNDDDDVIIWRSVQADRSKSNK